MILPLSAKRRSVRLLTNHDMLLDRCAGVCPYKPARPVTVTPPDSISREGREGGVINSAIIFLLPVPIRSVAMDSIISFESFSPGNSPVFSQPLTSWIVALEVSCH